MSSRFLNANHQIGTLTTKTTSNEKNTLLIGHHIGRGWLQKG